MIVQSVFYAIGVEVVLIFLTVFLLIRPSFFFQNGRFKAFSKWGGALFLFITFCWSIILGVLFSLSPFYLNFKF